MILFKYPEKQREFARADPRVRKIAFAMEDIVKTLWGEPLVVTEVWRTDPKSPHSDFRAIDFAMLEYGDSELLREIINKTFPYGAIGYETIPPLDHGGAPHLHVQVKP